MPDSLTLAWRLGHALLGARRAQQDPALAAIAAYGGGQVLFQGKVWCAARGCRPGKRWAWEWHALFGDERG
jgi:DUF917 family protein